ncbi:DUF1269 domain-containing protein [Streptomyces sp. NPDC048172]|uniref:DUF1269 domain-containing protein n=1 Tax=Streptomyces sp. NPDC048172 TaxID=3365505 RepID=UPI00372155BC
MTGIGPVQILSLGFTADAGFEPVVDELELLEENGQIRVLDLLFVEKESSGDLNSLDYQAEGMGDTVSALLGLEQGTLDDAGEAFPSLNQGMAFGLTLGEIRDVGEQLAPGTAAVFVLLEHVWARSLREAVRGAGGVPLAEGFLTEEALAPVAAELLAVASKLGEPEPRASAGKSDGHVPGRLHRRK